jgi:tetratricopeptide (TPR) repeat protein
MVRHNSIRGLLALLVWSLASGMSTGAPLDPDICPKRVVRDGEDGPYDYRSGDSHARKRIGQIESIHFNWNVRTLRGNSEYLAGNLDFLLRYIPNDHGGLKAMMDLSYRTRSEQPRGAGKTVTCYFEYAKLLAPDDSAVRTLYGIYLDRNGKGQRAIAELEEAVRLNPSDANAQYNLGLLLVDAGEFERALQHAHAAYALGFPLPGLRNKLVSSGKWREAAPVSAGSPLKGSAPEAQKKE